MIEAMICLKTTALSPCVTECPVTGLLFLTSLKRHWAEQTHSIPWIWPGRLPVWWQWSFRNYLYKPYAKCVHCLEVLHTSDSCGWASGILTILLFGKMYWFYNEWGLKQTNSFSFTDRMRYEILKEQMQSNAQAWQCTAVEKLGVGVVRQRKVLESSWIALWKQQQTV